MIKEYQLQKLQNSFEVTLNYKGVKVRVAFTGGNVYNKTRPKFRTDNPFKMKALEASELFKNKEVVLTRTIGSEPKPTVVPQRKRVATRQAGGAASVQEAATANKVAPVQEPTAETVNEVPLAQETGTESVDEATTSAGDDGMEKKVFANLAEAIMFIAQTWQISVQSEAEARNVLKQHGISPTIKKG